MNRCRTRKREDRLDQGADGERLEARADVQHLLAFHTSDRLLLLTRDIRSIR